MWACGGEGGKKVHKLLLDYQSKWLKQIVKLSENEREIKDYQSFWKSIMHKHLKKSGHYTMEGKKNNNCQDNLH